MVLITCLPIFIVTYFYVEYASKAWFWLDDFKFIGNYTASLQIHQLLDFSNFGRFVSRNLYWFLGEKLFSNHAQYYFLFNLLTILGTTLIIFKIFSKRYGFYVGLISGAFYFCLPATIFNYTWISNSQHLLGHFFLMLFVFDYLEAGFEQPIKASSVVKLLSILSAGLLSNIFVGMVLSLPAWMILTSPKTRQNRNQWLLLLLGGALFFVCLFKLRGSATGAYAVSLSWSTLKTNLVFYFMSHTIPIIWLSTNLIGIFLCWRRHRLFEAWLFLASILLFLPFAFLEYQRYFQYGALTYLFFMLGCWCVLSSFSNSKIQSSLPYAGMLGLLGLLWFSMLPIRFFIETPRGADQCQQIKQLKAFNDLAGSSIQHYCFRVLHPAENTKGLKIWDIPREWWSVNFGSAFILFVDPDKTYDLIPGAKSCEKTFIFDGPLLQQEAR